MSSKPRLQEYPVKTEGVLCESRTLSIGWPEAHEFDMITVLRNKPEVRHWFLSDGLLDLEANRVWLETGMDRPREALLSIRLKVDDTFLGTIGWTDWDRRLATASFGRLSLDTVGLRKALCKLPHGYGGLALDAASTLRDFAFRSMRLERAFTYFFAGNVMAERLNRRVGMVYTSGATRFRPDNTSVEAVEMYMDRRAWLRLQEAHEGLVG